MKKYLLLFILPFLFITSVKAETLTLEYRHNYIYNVSNYSELVDFFSENSIIINNLKTDVLALYNTTYSQQYPYYNIALLSPNGEYIQVALQMYETIPNFIFGPSSANSSGSNHYIESIYTFANTTYTTPTYYSNGNDAISYSFSNTVDFNDCFFIETNFTLTYDNSSYYDSITITNFRNNGNLTFYKGDSIDLSFDVINPTFTEVNLDNYEYVILSLKDYSQTNAFQTNLQLKGQIGITPVYNYGQTSKDAITGVQVQDRCNLSYSDYTNYPFYILQSDLQNNSVYYVKSCESQSSFKFDNTIFNITYITQSNLDNPTITINGNTYNTIPYSDLPSSATENEENNYIPGESGSATDTGGLDSAIKGAQNRLSEIWNTITYFTSFVGLIFSALPSELSTILISAFIVVTILGIIKLFVGH